jgi:hypothetical protein
MGLSFRKSISFGPMRVNLSTRGIGYSVGVKGARIGVNRRCTYVSMGAAGIQYRKYLHTPTPGHQPPAPRLPQEMGNLVHTITSEEISQISDVDSQNFIDELTEKAAKTPYAKWGALLLAVLLGFALLSYFGQVTRVEKFTTPKVEITAVSGLKIRQAPDPESAVVGSAVQGTLLALTDSNSTKHWYGVPGGFVSRKFARITQVPETREHLRMEEHPNWFWTGFGLCAACVLGAFIYLSRLDRERLTLELNYEFNDDLAQIHAEFLQAFGHIRTSNKVWQYLHSEQVTDKRRHSGADNSITRVSIGGVALDRKPSVHLKTNVPIPYLGLRNTELFFFPERLVIRRNKQFAAIFYKNLTLNSREPQFIEEESLPSDATVVGQTWKYLNKNGTPDRRFSNNRQIPLCRYSQYIFRSGTGVHEIVTTSRQGALDVFTKYVAAIGEFQRRMSIN